MEIVKELKRWKGLLCIFFVTFVHRKLIILKICIHPGQNFVEPRRQAFHNSLGPLLRHTCSLPGLWQFFDITSTNISPYKAIHYIGLLVIKETDVLLHDKNYSKFVGGPSENFEKVIYNTTDDLGGQGTVPPRNYIYCYLN